MSDTFEPTLANIKEQEAILIERDERQNEHIVIAPLLREIGWDPAKGADVYPQHGLSGGDIVDYDLQIDGESRILIEVKRWKYTLDEEDEDQLARYCRLANPKIGVLTNGHTWRLYLPPTKGKNATVRPFLEIDITKEQPRDVEDNFRRFLARDSMVNSDQTMEAAKDLCRKWGAYEKFKRDFTKAWNKLPEDNDTLTSLVFGFAAIKSIPANPSNVTRLLDSLDESLVNEIGKGSKSQKKPATFHILASPTGVRHVPRDVESPKSWNKLLLQLCTLMQKRNPKNFRQTILPMTGWFAETEEGKYKYPVGDTGIFARWENSAVNVRNACYEIVGEFGYSEDSLVIKDSNGAIL